MPHLLIIDDHRDIAETMALVMKLEGWTVEIASNGVDGLRAIAKDNIDLVLCDYHMPKMSGLDVLQALRNRPHPPVIIYSADWSVEAQAMALGAVGFFGKSCAIDSLVPMMTAHLRVAA